MTKEERARTRNYLYGAINLNKEIDDVLMRKEILLSKVMNPSINYDHEKVQTSGAKDTLGDLCAEIRDLEETVNGLIDDYVDAKEKIKGEISCIEDEKYRTILIERYVYDKRIGDIADSNDIPYQTCFARIRKGEAVFFNIHKHNI